MDTNRKILIFENPYTLTNHLLRHWNRLAEESIELSGRFTAALSGGKSPLEFYSRLSTMQEFEVWKKIHLFLADERFVPSDHADSNARVLKTQLLDYIDIPAANIHLPQTSFENVNMAAEEYKHQLMHFFKFRPGELPRFDFVLLGVGEDGHTASLFPGEADIDNPNRLTIPVSMTYLKQDRISLSASVINNARNIYFVVMGAQKAEIMKELLIDKKSLPASVIRPKDGNLVFLLDRFAAAQLSYQDSFTHEEDAISIIR